MTRNIQTSNLFRSFGVQRNNQAIIAYSTPHFRTPQARAAFHTSRSPAFQLHRRILQASNSHHSSYFKSLVQAQTRMVGLQILSDIAPFLYMCFLYLHFCYSLFKQSALTCTAHRPPPARLPIGSTLMISLASLNARSALSETGSLGKQVQSILLRRDDIIYMLAMPVLG